VGGTEAGGAFVLVSSRDVNDENDERAPVGGEAVLSAFGDVTGVRGDEGRDGPFALPALPKLLAPELPALEEAALDKDALVGAAAAGAAFAGVRVGGATGCSLVSFGGA